MGHDRERFVQVPPELICPTCLEVFKDPLKVCVEDHIFCRQCYDSYQNEQTLQGQVDVNYGRPRDACAICRGGKVMKGERTQSAKFIARLVGGLTVTCENKDFGCDWVGQLANQQGHLVSCPNRVIRCQNGLTVQGKMLRHEDYQDGDDDCLEDEMLPDRCHELVRAHQYMDHKRTTCEFQQLACPRGGKACVFLRIDKEEHTYTCGFHTCVVGDCPTIGTLDMLKLHEPACQDLHRELSMLRQSYSDPLVVKRLYQDMDRLEEENEDLEQVNHRLLYDLEVAVGHSNECESELERIKEAGDWPSDIIARLYATMANRAEHLQKTDDRVKKRDATIARLEADLRELQKVKTEHEPELTKRVPADHGIRIGKKRRIEEEEEDVKPKILRVK